jgi:hypothetical protein
MSVVLSPTKAHSAGWASRMPTAARLVGDISGTFEPLELEVEG